MTRTAITLTAAAAALLAGCGGSTPAPAPLQPAQTVTQAPPEASPAVLSVQDAGKAYLRIVAPLNRASFAADDERHKANPSLARLRRLDRALGDACAVFLRALAATAWPESVRDDVGLLQADVAGMMDAARQAQDAETLAEYGRAWAGYETNHAAQTLRAKLGIGEVPTNG